MFKQLMKQYEQYILTRRGFMALAKRRNYEVIGEADLSFEEWVEYNASTEDLLEVAKAKKAYNLAKFKTESQYVSTPNGKERINPKYLADTAITKSKLTKTEF